MGSDGKRNSGTRQSALWGSGTRGGERHSSALWGRGGRLAAALLVAAFALCAPLAALADPGNGQSKAALVTATRTATPKASRQSTFVPPALLERAQANGNQRLHVIIQATGGTGAAASAFAANGQRDGGTVSKRLSLINGVAVDLKAKWIMRLAKVPGLVVTLDAPVETAGRLTNSQLWPYVSGNSKLWGSRWQPAPNAPTIAIVDSGIDAAKQDFVGRAYPQVNLSSATPDAQGDGDGHGTFVAGIAAGGNDGYAGASPNSHILPIRVMDDNGAARTSDVSRRGAVDPREQGHLQHQGRELLAALGDRHALLLRPARPRGREALAERRRRGRGVRATTARRPARAASSTRPATTRS